jgi:hypothetical protein
VRRSTWHCQSKFHTACSRTTAGWSPTVFARELPPRSAGFNAENRLYSFALTMPFGGFLGMGNQYHPLPWSVLKYDTNLGGYVVNLDKRQLEGAGLLRRRRTGLGRSRLRK